jgi:hypothetical protein
MEKEKEKKEVTIYQTRSMPVEDKQRMRVLGAQAGKSLEAVVNRVIEIGLPLLESVVAKGGW